MFCSEYLLYILIENPDACATAADIYSCGVENQVDLVYNMTKLGEGDPKKV